MIARAGLVAARHGDRTRCTELRSDPPLSLRETASGVHLVASGAGPVGGDDLQLTVRLGAGAELEVRSVAASMAHPGPTGRTSHLLIDVELDAGASLDWRPQPTILVRGCDHHGTARVRLGTDATLRWRDELVLGRHEEPTGSVLQRLRVDDAVGPLLRTDLALGPRWAGSLGPGGAAGAGAIGTLLVVAPDAGERFEELPERPGVRWAATRLRDDPSSGPAAVLVTALAPSAGALADALDRITEEIALVSPSSDN